MDVRVGLWRKLSKEELRIENWGFWTVVLEKTLESPLDCKNEPVHPKGDQSWVFIGKTDAEAETPILGPPHGEELTHWKRPWFWEGLEAGGEGGDRGWNGWMASPTPWTWVWVNSGSWWWTGRPCVLRFMGWQRVGHDWWTELNCVPFFLVFVYLLSIFFFAAHSWSLLLSIFDLWLPRVSCINMLTHNYIYLI